MLGNFVSIPQGKTWIEPRSMTYDLPDIVFVAIVINH